MNNFQNIFQNVQLFQIYFLYYLNQNTNQYFVMENIFCISFLSRENQHSAILFTHNLV